MLEPDPRCGYGEIAYRQRRLGQSLTRRGLMTSLAMLAASTGLPAFAASVPRNLLRYRVTHSAYGGIGTYSNVIDEQGDTIVVQTEMHLVVTMIGIVLHREDAQRVERWSGDRLIEFHGVTTVNGDATEIRGEARAEGFAIISAQGTIMAPATVRPSNPWSARFLGADMMMQTDTGMVQPIRISAPTPVSVTIDEVTMQAQKYDIAATPSYTIWLDEAGLPVMFNMQDDSGLVTFTLSTRP